MSVPSRISRRSFASGAALVSSTLVSRASPNDRLNIAAVGVGGMGAAYLAGCDSENIVALCDVDHALAAKTFAKYPKARQFRDFRVMLEQEKNIDAVIIGTPDHTHAVVALAAMRAGKAVYCAKPLTRTIAECRTLVETAAERKVATQMSVQSCGSEAARATAEWVRAGAVGSVDEVWIWNDRPVWPQAVGRPEGAVPVPESLDWDLWLGPAAKRAFHPVYHPFNWRGWTDFGTGALGDMACHALHVVFDALELVSPPVQVQASISNAYRPALNNDADMPWMRARKLKLHETFPHASLVTWDFAASDRRPAVRVHWCDGGMRPPRPRELDSAARWPDNGILFVGKSGLLLSGFTGGPRLLPEARNAEFTAPPPTLPRTVGHYQEWIAAAKGGPPATCHFPFAGVITETALLGVIAQRTGRPLLWHSRGMTVANEKAANELVRPAYQNGWSL